MLTELFEGLTFTKAMTVLGYCTLAIIVLILILVVMMVIDDKLEDLQEKKMRPVINKTKIAKLEDEIESVISKQARHAQLLESFGITADQIKEVNDDTKHDPRST
jgi:phage tail sheath protein FI